MRCSQLTSACFALLLPPTPPCSHLIHLTRRVRLLPGCFYGLLSGLLSAGVGAGSDADMILPVRLLMLHLNGPIMGNFWLPSAWIWNLYWWSFACRFSSIPKWSLWTNILTIQVCKMFEATHNWGQVDICLKCKRGRGNCWTLFEESQTWYYVNRHSYTGWTVNADKIFVLQELVLFVLCQQTCQSRQTRVPIRGPNIVGLNEKPVVPRNWRHWIAWLWPYVQMLGRGRI